MTTIGSADRPALRSFVLFAFLIVLTAPQRVGQSVPSKKDIPAIARVANGSIVSIVMSDKDGKPIAQGSGFFVSKDGLIVTNYHVIAEGSSAVVKLPDGAFYLVDGVFAFDRARDVAVIKAHGQKFRSLTLGNSDQLQIGEEVVAIGNPLSLESTVSNGIVSGIRVVKEEGGKYLQITAPISPGSSGGPLFNMVGEVIGITTMYLKGGENLNFAIPINDAKQLLSTNSSKLGSFPDEPQPVKSTNTEPSRKPAFPSTIPRYWTHLGDGSRVEVRIDGDHLYEMSDQNLQFKYICDLKFQDSRWAGKCTSHFIAGDGVVTSIHSCTLETGQFITSVSPTRIEGESQDVEFVKALPPPDIYSSGFQPCPRIGTGRVQFALIPRD